MKHKEVYHDMQNWFILIVILMFALGLRIFFFTGVNIPDSFVYSNSANDFLNGNYYGGNHMQNRLGVVATTALSYKLFGVSDFSSAIIPLLFSLASIILIYKIGKKYFNPDVGLLSAFLLAIFPMDILLSTALMGDVPAMFFCSLSMFMLFEKKYSWSGIWLGFAYLFRENSLLLLLPIGIIIWINDKDILDKIIHGFVLLEGYLVIMMVELITFTNLAKDPFLRFHTMSGSWSEIVASKVLYSGGNFLFARYIYTLFTDNLISLFFVFGIIAVIVLWKQQRCRNLLIWFVPVTLYLCFGTSSVSHWLYFPPDIRLMSIAIFPMLILLSAMLSGLFNHDYLHKLTYAILIVLLVTSIGFIYKNPTRHMTDSERGVFEFLQNSPIDWIFADEVTVQRFNYLSEYKSKAYFIPYQTYEYPKWTNVLDMENLERGYVVIYPDKMEYRLKNLDIKYPDEVLNIPDNWDLIYDKNIKIYQIAVEESRDMTIWG